jgi:hypothetical protein
MRQTNNSMSSVPPANIPIKQEPKDDDAKFKNPTAQPAPSIKSMPQSKPPVNFASLVTPNDNHPPPASASLDSVRKPIPVLFTAGMTGSGAAGAFSSCKRRESHENPDARLTKVQCNHLPAGGGFDMLDDTIQNVASALGRERTKYMDELAKKDAQCAEEIQKIRDDCAEQLRKSQAAVAEAQGRADSALKQLGDLQARHDAEIEQQSVAFAKELNKHKTELDASFRQRLEEANAGSERIIKGLQLELAKAKAELETTQKNHRDDFRSYQRDFDEREARHRNNVITEMGKSYEKRLELIKHQFDSECRAQLAEQRTGYERRIATLETEVVGLKHDIELRREVRKACEALPPFLDGVYSATSQLGVFKTQVAEITAKAVEIGNQANHLQGYMTALQSNAVQRPPQIFYYPPHPGAAMPTPAGRGRHGAFHAEAAHGPP